jgi:hypothetical protein
MDETVREPGGRDAGTSGAGIRRRSSTVLVDRMTEACRAGSSEAREQASTSDHVILSLDHAFVDPRADDLADAVYEALGALDASSPEAILALGLDDLRSLVAATERWMQSSACPAWERTSLEGSVRRVRHLLERGDGRSAS